MTRFMPKPRQLDLFRLGGGCNARRCDGTDYCRCRDRLRPMPCGCPAVVDGLKGAHADGCPYVADRAGDSLIGWAQRTGRNPWPQRVSSPSEES